MGVRCLISPCSRTLPAMLWREEHTTPSTRSLGVIETGISMQEQNALSCVLTPVTRIHPEPAPLSPKTGERISPILSYRQINSKEGSFHSLCAGPALHCEAASCCLGSQNLPCFCLGSDSTRQNLPGCRTSSGQLLWPGPAEELWGSQELHH